MSAKQKAGLFGLALTLLGLAVGFGVCDLEISNAVYRPESRLSLFMEKYAILVEPCLAGLGGTILLAGFWRLSGAGRRAGMFLGAAAVAGSFGYLASQFHAEGAFAMAGVLLILLLLSLAALLLVLRLPPKALKELLRAAAVTVVFIAAALLVILVLKTFWGRVRFREMTEPAQFSRWFLPRGINGHHSFPSGHTSNAATLWVLTLAAPFFRRNWQKALCYFVPLAWILLMAAARVVAGAHFASDTLFGAAITVALFYPVRRLVFWRTDRWMGGKVD